jgi:predicted DsbA family dithiol-disulfide isomerase
VQPNTVKAHRLMHHAGELGKQDAMAEALFRAYFVEGANLTDDATLAEYAAQAGLDRKEILAYLATDSDVDLIHSADVEARQVGISGVPFFIFNRTVGVSGAQEPDVLLQAMEQARQG